MADPIQGVIRSPNAYAVQTLSLNERGEVIVAGGLPPYAEYARRGVGWATMSTAAVAALVVRPSTVAAFEIFNGYAAGGKSLIVDRLFWFQLVSTAVGESFTGWAAVTAAKAAVTSGSFTVRGNTGKGYGGPVIAAAGTTVLDSGWFPWAVGSAKVAEATSVIPFGGAVANVEGRLIVPPQSSLCLHVVASVVGQTFTQGASWYEEQITNE